MTALTAGHWRGDAKDVAFDPEEMRRRLLALDLPCYAVSLDGRVGLTTSGDMAEKGVALLGFARPLPAGRLGDPSFQSDYGVRLSYAAGSMANGIASEAVVTALGSQRLLGSFGAAGLLPSRIAQAIQQLKSALPDQTYAFNLIHSPNEDALERAAVDLYLREGVRLVEASAYLDLSPHVVRYRVAGLGQAADGSVLIRNRVIAKVSRREVAAKFLQPPPPPLLSHLLAEGSISSEQARLAERVRMCDDLTVEADSGGHTDNRPLVSLLPSLIELRDSLCTERQVRVGAGGGIGTPASALAAFMMGAAYVVTGSVNQSCVEAGTSSHTKKLLADAGMADVTMAPAADMFEMGVQVQLLKRGTLFPMRAQRLFELYQSCDSLESIPVADRDRLERQIFRRPLGQVWDDVERYFHERDPEQLRLAKESPKRKMSLVFRWYLGLSSRWSNSGEAGREMDYQVWCGPAMGAFNDWVRGSYLEAPERRSVADVAWHMMRGAAYLYRLADLRLQGVRLPSGFGRYVPEPPVS